MINKKYGRLRLLKKVENHPVSRNIQYLCQCDCGQKKIVRLNLIKRGVSLSCGCLQQEARKRKRTYETRQKMSISQKNKKPASEETRLKMSLAQIGSKSIKWKGGKTKLTELIRKSSKYKEWRLGVFKRDNFICTNCGYVKGNKIEADHIIPFYFLMSFYKIKSKKQALLCNGFWDLDNGRTLCKICHKKTETYGNCLDKLKMKYHKIWQEILARRYGR